MELVKLGEKTYCLKNPTNIGIYKINDNEVYLIDTGNDKDCGKKILKILESENLKVKGIIATHSNSDHIGGNKVITERCKAFVLTHGIEISFTKYPLLEPSFLYGSYPFKDLQNKFLMAKGTDALEIDGNLEEGMEYFNLKGHFFDMIGIKTSDNVYFLADSLFSQETINKYHIFFLYDVEEYLNTLEFLKTLKGNWFVPSHGEITKDITSLIELNKRKIFEICDFVLNICTISKTFEEIEEEVFKHYELEMNLNQYYLIGSTLKAYLSYLYSKEKISYYFKELKMYWQTNEEKR